MITKNTATQYGWVSKFFHWGLVLLVLIQFYLILWKRYVLPEQSPIASFYISGLHKPIGMVALIFTLLAIFWHMINIKPVFPIQMPEWEKCAAKSVHFLLYVCMCVLPISGLLMSVSAGFPPNFFGLFQVPMFLEKNKAVANFFFEVHEITATLLVILVFLHVAAALKHHFIERDDVLRRML